MGAGARVLVDLRSKTGLSQRALARAAGVPASTIARIESGRTDATIGMLERIARAADRQLVVFARPAGPTIAQVGRPRPS